MTSMHKQTYISELRSQYHSLNSDDRLKAITNLASGQNSDSIRELIHVYNECGWRETKFQIIKAMSVYTDIRSLDFLFTIAAQSDDLPLAEAAIYTLGETKNFLASRFLCHLYLFGDLTLKPACALSLGKLADRSLLKHFLIDLEKGYKNQQNLLVKNLVLCLGELKALPSVGLLKQIAQNKVYRDVALSAVVSLGKITKNIKDFDDLEIYFKSDSFEYQIFNNAKNQCLFRSGWKIEDYLNKIINNDQFHPALLLEFNAFTSDELQLAFDLLAESNQFRKIFDILSRIESSHIDELYKKYFDLMISNSIQEQKSFLASVSFHQNEKLITIIKTLHDACDQSYVSARLFCSVHTDKFVKDLFNSDFLQSESSVQILLINTVHEYLLTCKSQTKTLNLILKEIEDFILKLTFDQHKQKFLFKATGLEIEKAIYSRIIRLFGHFKYKSSKLNSEFLSLYLDHEIKASVYFYFQNVESSYFISEIEKKIDTIDHEQGVSLLRVLLQNSSEHKISKNLEQFLKKLSLVKNNDDMSIGLLKVIRHFKLVQFKEYVLSLAQSENLIIQFHVVLALQVFNDETLADKLAVFLHSKSASLSGRALDALLKLPGNRAKRLVFDFLQDHYNQIDIVRKITRDFNPPENDTDYFAVQVGDILKKINVEDRSSQDEEDILLLLQDFKTELLQNQKSFSLNKIKPTEADLIAIDTAFEKLIPSYIHFDEASKSALRSAEVPFKHPELFDSFVDKSSIILGYSKAIDIVLEKQLGKKILQPKLESKLSDFQNVFHSLGLQEDYPVGDKILKLLQLEKNFTVHTLPVHKMGLIAKGFLSNKIINEQFKILDGLRAWAIVLLIFARKSTVLNRPLITVIEDESYCIQLAKKLMWLQDVRNPIAHRQTVVEFTEVEHIRLEVLEILKLMNKILFS